MKVPTTVEDHLALAKSYEQKAAEYRKEAEHHHHMFVAYKSSIASSPKSPPPQSVVKMQKHCQVMARDAVTNTPASAVGAAIRMAAGTAM